MRVGLFVDGSFLPSREGATERIYLLAKYLPSIGVDVVLFHCCRGWSDVSLIQKERFTTYLLSPDQYYHNPSLIGELVQAEGIHILQMCDPTLVLSVGLPVKMAAQVKLIWEIHEIVSSLLPQLGAPGIQEHSGLEINASKCCDHLVCFTEKDHLELTALGIPSDKIAVVPCGIDITSLPFFGPNKNSQSTLFLGNMFYEPNYRAARLIIDVIQPLVCSTIKDAKFKMVGTFPNDLIACQNESLVFTGPLDSWADVFGDVRIGIAPIQACSGVRIKLLCYMAAGLPIISTSSAAVGIKHDGGILIEDSIPTFAHRIIDLLLHPLSCIRLGVRGRSRIEQYHDWLKIVPKLGALYDQIASGNSCIPLSSEVARIPSIALPLPLWLEETLTKRRFASGNIAPIELPAVIRDHVIQLVHSHPNDHL
jgi:glycosyltransferase involved in cell wall biosynthesis